VSSVALVEDEIVGHHAILLPTPGAASAETGVAVVHSAYRGLGVFGRLFDHTLARARAAALAAIYGRAVTVHPYSQRAESAHGYRPSALMLGAVGPEMTMAGLSGSARRTAHLLSVRVLRPAPRSVTLPSRYADNLRATYAHLELDIDRAPQAGDERALVAGSDDPGQATATIRIAGWHSQAPAGLLRAIRHLDERHNDVIYADVDLHAAADVDAVVAALNQRYFFYSGLVPFGPDGHDHLRLQRINSENVETEGIVCEGDFARGLRTWVTQDRAQLDPGA
jgi:hypothetical protein